MLLSGNIGLEPDVRRRSIRDPKPLSRCNFAASASTGLGRPKARHGRCFSSPDTSRQPRETQRWPSNFWKPRAKTPRSPLAAHCSAADQAVRHRDRQCHAGAGGRSDRRPARRRHPHASQLRECRLREHRLPQPGVSGSLAAVGSGVRRRHRRAGGRRRVGPAGLRQRQRHRSLSPLGRRPARHRQADLPAGRSSGRGRGSRWLVGQELSRRGVGRLAARLLLRRGRGRR